MIVKIVFLTQDDEHSPYQDVIIHNAERVRYQVFGRFSSGDQLFTQIGENLGSYGVLGPIEYPRPLSVISPAELEKTRTAVEEAKLVLRDCIPALLVSLDRLDQEGWFHYVVQQACCYVMNDEGKTIDKVVVS
jgi:hypothetical protein